MLYVVLSSRTSLSFVTDDRVSTRGRAGESGIDTLFYDGLVKDINIGWFDGLSAVLLEGGKPIADAAGCEHTGWNSQE